MKPPKAKALSLLIYHDDTQSELCDEAQAAKERIINFQGLDSGLPSSMDCVSIHIFRSPVKLEIHNLTKYWLHCVLSLSESPFERKWF